MFLNREQVYVFQALLTSLYRMFNFLFIKILDFTAYLSNYHCPHFHGTAAESGASVCPGLHGRKCWVQLEAQPILKHRGLPLAGAP